MSTVYFDEVGQIKLDKVIALLGHIPGGVYRAVGSATKRAAQHGLTVGMRIVSEEYAITQGDLKRKTRNMNTVVKDGGESYETTFGYRGNVIPLSYYDTVAGAKSGVSTRVLRSSTREKLNDAFKARMGNHVGIYERIGSDRFPVREKFGPSAVQAFYAREEVVDKMEDEIMSTYDRRIDHEISRILNGYGG